VTVIDGQDIHFIHVRSKHKNAFPLIVTHGWPGSIIEQLKIVDPLTNPTAHGASAAGRAGLKSSRASEPSNHDHPGGQESNAGHSSTTKERNAP
jgi:hypothetical protein